MTLLNLFSNFLSGSNGQMMYWFLAIAGSAFFGITLLMSFFGGLGEDVDSSDADGHFDEAHSDTGVPDFKLFSLRTVFVFIMMFGWGGIVFGKENGYTGFFAAFACGLFTMVIAALIIFLILKLQQNGTKSSKSLIGCCGNAYISIPADRSGSGKVTVNTGSDTREISAMADEALPTGTPVVIVESIGAGKFLVKKN